MAQVNPAMITIARESRGWTQKQLARSIGAAASTVCRYEIDSSGVLPTDERLQQIAEVLRFDPSFFTQQTPAVGLGGDFLYRRRANVPAYIRSRVEAEANVRRLQVERLLKKFEVGDRLPFPVIPLDAVGGRPDKAAIELRKAWRMPKGPVGNLTQLIESAGGIVFLVDFETDLIDGTNMRLPGLPPLLFLNQNVPGERHRFNLAHELGHVTMHFGVAIGDAEDEANLFAQEFIMPKAEIKSDLKNLDLASAARLKQVWKVSMAAIVMRARTLKIISPSKASKLFAAIRAQDYRSREPMPLEIEKPTVFNHLVAEHMKLGLGENAIRQLLFTEHLGKIDPPKPRDNQLRLVGMEDDFND